MRNIKYNLGLLPALLSVGLFFGGCLFDEPLDEEAPDMYSEFSNVSFSGQVARLDMLAAMTAYMKTGNGGVELDATKLKSMYANSGNPFGEDDLNTSGKQLNNKTFGELATTQFEPWMDSIAEASVAGAAGTEASNGQAGILTDLSGEKSYLVGANGMEYTQLIEKGLMGAVFYHQGTGVYLSTNSKLAEEVDNETVEEGKGTALQHHWDEGFGYFAGDVDFPDEGTDRFWGKYSNGRDALLGSNQKVLQGFIKGRHAINQDDRETMAQAIKEVRAAWEDVVAGTAIHYLNGAIANFRDDALRCHELSEAWAFISALKYNPSRTMSTADIDGVLETIGENFWDVTVANLTAARDQLSAAHGLDDVKDEL